MDKNLQKKLKLELETQNYQDALNSINELIASDIDNASLWWQWFDIRLNILKGSISKDDLVNAADEYFLNLTTRFQIEIQVNEKLSLFNDFSSYVQGVFLIKEIINSNEYQKFLNITSKSDFLKKFNQVFGQLLLSIYKLFPKLEVLDLTFSVIEKLKSFGFLQSPDINFVTSDLEEYLYKQYFEKRELRLFDGFLALVSHLQGETVSNNKKVTIDKKVQQIKIQDEANLFNENLNKIIHQKELIESNNSNYLSAISIMEDFSKLEKPTAEKINLKQLDVLKEIIENAKPAYEQRTLMLKKKQKAFLKFAGMAIIITGLIAFSTDLFILKRNVIIVDPMINQETTYFQNTFSKISFSEPSKEGFVFDGYFLDETLTQAFNPDSDRIPYATLRLYTKWLRISYKLTLVGLNEDPIQITIPFDESILYHINNSVTVEENRPLYYFNGWSSDENHQDAITTARKMPANELTLYARWSPNQYNIRLISAVIPKDISVGHQHALVLDSMGNLFSFGSNEYLSARGVSTHTATIKKINSNFSLLSNEKIKNIFAGYNTSYAVTTTGRVFSWGVNSRYLLGNSSTSNSTTPINISTYFSTQTITSISANQYHALALSSSGNVYSWGDNDYGALGNNNIYSTHRTPTNITNLFTSLLNPGEKIVKVNASTFRSHVITSSGRYFYWGNQNSTDRMLVPTLNETISNITNLSYRYNHGIFLGNDDSWLQGNGIWSAWNGYNPLVGNSNIISSDVGLEHTAFITSGNRLYVFGNNDSGQLGNNSYINQGLSIASRRTITGLYTGETLTKVYTMERGTFVLTSLGRLFVFGRNANGQLGTNSLTYELIPVTNSLNLQNVTYQLGHGLNIRNNLPQLQKDGFLLLGYYYDKEFTNQLSTSQLMPTNDIMIYAKWS